ncbi:hypothetical protein SAMN02745866_04314 [Alteromonadaceae bacterium Bs31]|nr:hypothetical protein SAMN02745866_04314 [Alteromonadaceae bacterium Bs31]
MKVWFLISLTFIAGCGAATSSKTENHNSVENSQEIKFRSAGAVTGFQELCLKQLSTPEGYKMWSVQNSKNVIQDSKYKKSAGDTAYKIGNEIASFILVKHASLGCSVFAQNIDGMAAHIYLQQVFIEARNGNPGSEIKMDTISNGIAATHGVVLVSESGTALIDVIISINTESDNTRSLALTGAVAGGI